jgi:hypothetical protein
MPYKGPRNTIRLLKHLSSIMINPCGHVKIHLPVCVEGKKGKRGRRENPPLGYLERGTCN